MKNSNKRYSLPKFKKGQQVKIIGTGHVSGVIRISYESGHNWYTVRDKDGIEKNYAEPEIKPA